MKRLFCMIICACLLLTFTACNDDPVAEETKDPAVTEDMPKEPAITLSEEDRTMLQAMEGDIIDLTEADFAATVADLNSHAAAHAGMVYRFEGVYRMATMHDEQVPYIGMDLDGAFIGLPVNYLTVDLVEGQAVRVVGILSVGDDGHGHPMLDVIAIESIVK